MLRSAKKARMVRGPGFGHFLVVEGPSLLEGCLHSCWPASIVSWYALLEARKVTPKLGELNAQTQKAIILHALGSRHSSPHLAALGFDSLS